MITRMYLQKKEKMQIQMNIRKFCFTLLAVSLVSLSCVPDDDTPAIVPTRDKQEVYDEDIAEIEEYLSTHFYNYEEYDDANEYSLANDEFEIVFDTINSAMGTGDKTPLMDQVETKIVNRDGIDYKLYVLKVREGLGDNLHLLDKAVVKYNGTLSNGDSFDSSVNPVSFNLTPVGTTISGVVTGFREALVEFKTSTGYDDNPDGSTIYHNHGIGAVFIPSGLGYFSGILEGIPSYSPIFFRLSLLARNDTDFDLDGVPSHIEDIDGDGDGTNDNTDGDSLVNFIDSDDDGDGVLTQDEVVRLVDNYLTLAEAEAHVLGVNDIFIKIVKGSDDTYNVHTLTLVDSNNDGIPNYLDANSTESN